jgi:rRNA maturation RNase YbeY
MPVLLTSRRRRRGLRAKAVRDDGTRLLRELRVTAELSIALIGDDEMRELNARYRHKDRPTDVLSFEMGGTTVPGETAVLGDVVISVDTAARQAAARNAALADEVRVLLVHGVLHLIGYDHERSPAEARRMFAKQRALVARLAERRPGRHA